MTKKEWERQAHLEEVRSRVASCERLRPDEPKTRDLRRMLDDLERQDRDRAAFAQNFGGLQEIGFRGGNVRRLLRLTGERPERIAEMREILAWLGLGYENCLGCGGVFDHGTMWGRGGKPFAIVGDPYGISDDAWRWLRALTNYPTLHVAVDDRPSFYNPPSDWRQGIGNCRTHHVRVSVPEPRPPFDPGPSSRATRAAARAARLAFALEGLPRLLQPEPR